MRAVESEWRNDSRERNRPFAVRDGRCAVFHMPERKPFLLRIDPKLLEQLRRWADADLRSLNAQIEFLLHKAVVDAKRAKDETSRQK